MLTSSPRKRNSLGSRTAWLRPLRKIFAVGMIDTSLYQPNGARLFQADALWGLAAVLWILTGVLRVFGGLEKTPAFYLGNGFFWVKMGLFVLILALEVRPMVTVVRWRAARARGRAPVAGSNWNALIALNDPETVVVVLIPFVAALMARGAWLFSRYARTLSRA